MTIWHHLGEDEVLRRLGGHPTRGLAEQEAAERRRQFGPNTLSAKQPPGLLIRFLAQLKDPMILVLLGAAGLSLAAGGGEDWVEAAIILLIVLVNAGMALRQEASARKALEALRQMAAPTARVVRDGVGRRIPASMLVPGDLVTLSAGDLVPADGRLLTCGGLGCDESAMTGESGAVIKACGVKLAPETAVADRVNTVLAGTVVVTGGGKCIITATGMDTEMGKIAGLLLEEETGVSPLQRKMGEVSGTLSLLCLAVCALLFGIGLLRRQALAELLLISVSLAVAAIPEGLPAIVAIVLAMGTGRMAKRGAIVKTLPAVETLGCAGVVCSDKTGTLTCNRMAVTELLPAPGGSRAQLLAAAALCCNAEVAGKTVTGDPTETAMVTAALAEGLDPAALAQAWPRVGELPFDSTRKRMTTVHALANGGVRVVMKGAPDVLYRRCTAVPPEVRRQGEALAQRGLRVLGVAWRDLPARPPGDEELERGLTFLGLFGLVDPPRPEAADAVARCRRAGIRPVMITGDHKLTALAIARELDLFRPGDLALTGEELDYLPPQVLEEEIHRFAVFARVTPEHKLRIVKAWRRRGQVVAMTGDGVNDAPALKAADIGCAMGKGGTDVARGAADLILTDDNFATIVSAVEEGRAIYANIKKAVHYLLSCNIGEVVAIAAATALGFPQSPLLPVQLLWLNLVTDSLPALALGVEPVEAGMMDVPPRDGGEPLFTAAFALELLWQGLLVGLVTLLAFRLGLKGGDYPAANTMAFATLTLCQLFHAYDVRSGRLPLGKLGVLGNRAMNRAWLAGMAMQGAVLLAPPLMGVFSTVPLTPSQWGVVAGLSLAPVAVCETVKWLSLAAEPKEPAKPLVP